MTPLRMAVVGVGSLGRHHAAKLSGFIDVDLVGVVDPAESSGRQVAEQQGTEWYAEVSQLPRDLDGVVIATPTIYHLDAAEYFLEKGVATFVEKPLAANCVDAETLWQKAAKSDALLQVGHIERFNPAFQEVQKRSEKPLYVRCQRVAPYTFRSTDIGVIHDLMIHDIDLALALTGELPDKVDAFGAVGIGPNEDMAVARLKMPSGAVVDITSSRMSPVVERSIQVWDVAGCIHGNLQSRVVQHWAPQGQFRSNPGLVHAIAAATPDPRTLKDRVFGEWIQAEEIQAGDDDQLSLELQEFMAAIRGFRAPQVGGREAVAAMAVADQVRESLDLWSYQPQPEEAQTEFRRAA